MLDGAKFVCLENGQEITVKGRNFTIGYLMDCDYVLAEDNRAERIHCQIDCDAFGHVTIYNKSEKNPISINGEIVNIKRTLFNNSKIKILDKEFLWQYNKSVSNVNCNIAQNPEEMSTPNKQIGIPEQPPTSCPTLRYHRHVPKRFTMHNLHAFRIDNEENQSTEEDVDRQAEISEISSIDADMNTPSKVDVVDRTPDKSTSSTEERRKAFRSMCGWSGMTTTSYTPRKAGICVEKTFTAIIPPPTNRSSLCRTPKGVLERLHLHANGTIANKQDTNNIELISFATPTKKPDSDQPLLVQHSKSAMKIIDLTTPSKLRPESLLSKSLTCKRPIFPKNVKNGNSSIISNTPKHIVKDTFTPTPAPSPIVVDSSSESDNSSIGAVTSTTPVRTPLPSTQSSVLRKQVLLASAKKQIPSTTTTPLRSVAGQTGISRTPRINTPTSTRNTTITTPITTQTKVRTNISATRAVTSTSTSSTSSSSNAFARDNIDTMKKNVPFRKLDMSATTKDDSIIEGMQSKCSTPISSVKSNFIPTNKRDNEHSTLLLNTLTTSTPYKDTKIDKPKLERTSEYLSGLQNIHEDENKSDGVSTDNQPNVENDDILKEIQEILSTSDELKRQLRNTKCDEDDREEDEEEEEKVVEELEKEVNAEINKQNEMQPTSSQVIAKEIEEIIECTSSPTKSTNQSKTPSKSSLTALILLQAINSTEKTKSSSPNKDDEKENQINECAATPISNPTARRRISVSTADVTSVVGSVEEIVRNDGVINPPLTPKKITRRRSSISLDNDEVKAMNNTQRNIDQYNTENMGAIVEEAEEVNEEEDGVETNIVAESSVNCVEELQERSSENDLPNTTTSDILKNLFDVAPQLSPTETVNPIEDKTNDVTINAEVDEYSMSPLQCLDESFAEPINCEELLNESSESNNEKVNEIENNDNEIEVLSKTINNKEEHEEEEVKNVLQANVEHIDESFGEIQQELDELNRTFNVEEKEVEVNKCKADNLEDDASTTEIENSNEKINKKIENEKLEVEKENEIISTTEEVENESASEAVTKEPTDITIQKSFILTQNTDETCINKNQTSYGDTSSLFDVSDNKDLEAENDNKIIIESVSNSVDEAEMNTTEKKLESLEQQSEDIGDDENLQAVDELCLKLNNEEKSITAVEENEFTENCSEINLENVTQKLLAEEEMNIFEESTTVEDLVDGNVNTSSFVEHKNSAETKANEKSISEVIVSTVDDEIIEINSDKCDEVELPSEDKIDESVDENLESTEEKKVEEFSENNESFVLRIKDEDDKSSADIEESTKTKTTVVSITEVVANKKSEIIEVQSPNEIENPMKTESSIQETIESDLPLKIEEQGVTTAVEQCQKNIEIDEKLSQVEVQEIEKEEENIQKVIEEKIGEKTKNNETNQEEEEEINTINKEDKESKGSRSTVSEISLMKADIQLPEEIKYTQIDELNDKDLNSIEVDKEEDEKEPEEDIKSDEILNEIDGNINNENNLIEKPAEEEDIPPLIENEMDSKQYDAEELPFAIENLNAQQLLDESLREIEEIENVVNENNGLSSTTGNEMTVEEINPINGVSATQDTADEQETSIEEELLKENITEAGQSTILVKETPPTQSNELAVANKQSQKEHEVIEVQSLSEVEEKIEHSIIEETKQVKNNKDESLPNEDTKTIDDVNTKVEEEEVDHCEAEVAEVPVSPEIEEPESSLPEEVVQSSEKSEGNDFSLKEQFSLDEQSLLEEVQSSQESKDKNLSMEKQSTLKEVEVQLSPINADKHLFLEDEFPIKDVDIKSSQNNEDKQQPILEESVEVQAPVKNDEKICEEQSLLEEVVEQQSPVKNDEKICEEQSLLEESIEVQSPERSEKDVFEDESVLDEIVEVQSAEKTEEEIIERQSLQEEVVEIQSPPNLEGGALSSAEQLPLDGVIEEQSSQEIEHNKCSKEQSFIEDNSVERIQLSEVVEKDEEKLITHQPKIDAYKKSSLEVSEELETSIKEQLPIDEIKEVQSTVQQKLDEGEKAPVTEIDSSQVEKSEESIPPATNCSEVFEAKTFELAEEEASVTEIDSSQVDEYKESIPLTTDTSVVFEEKTLEELVEEKVSSTESQEKIEKEDSTGEQTPQKDEIVSDDIVDKPSMDQFDSNLEIVQSEDQKVLEDNQVKETVSENTETEESIFATDEFAEKTESETNSNVEQAATIETEKSVEEPVVVKPTGPEMESSKSDELPEVDAKLCNSIEVPDVQKTPEIILEDNLTLEDKHESSIVLQPEVEQQYVETTKDSQLDAVVEEESPTEVLPAVDLQLNETEDTQKTSSSRSKISKASKKPQQILRIGTRRRNSAKEPPAPKKVILVEPGEVESIKETDVLERPIVENICSEANIPVDQSPVECNEPKESLQSEGETLAPIKKQHSAEKEEITPSDNAEDILPTLNQEETTQEVAVDKTLQRSLRRRAAGVIKYDLSSDSEDNSHWTTNRKRRPQKTAAHKSTQDGIMDESNVTVTPAKRVRKKKVEEDEKSETTANVEVTKKRTRKNIKQEVEVTLPTESTPETISTQESNTLDVDEAADQSPAKKKKPTASRTRRGATKAQKETETMDTKEETQDIKPEAVETKVEVKTERRRGGRKVEKVVYTEEAEPPTESEVGEVFMKTEIVETSKTQKKPVRRARGQKAQEDVTENHPQEVVVSAVLEEEEEIGKAESAPQKTVRKPRGKKVAEIVGADTSIVEAKSKPIAKRKGRQAKQTTIKSDEHENEHSVSETTTAITTTDEVVEKVPAAEVSTTKKTTRARRGKIVTPIESAADDIATTETSIPQDMPQNPEDGNKTVRGGRRGKQAAEPIETAVAAKRRKPTKKELENSLAKEQHVEEHDEPTLEIDVTATIDSKKPRGRRGKQIEVSTTTPTAPTTTASRRKQQALDAKEKAETPKHIAEQADSEHEEAKTDHEDDETMTKAAAKKPRARRQKTPATEIIVTETSEPVKTGRGTRRKHVHFDEDTVSVSTPTANKVENVEAAITAIEEIPTGSDAKEVAPKRRRRR